MSIRRNLVALAAKETAVQAKLAAAAQRAAEESGQKPEEKVPCPDNDSVEAEAEVEARRVLGRSWRIVTGVPAYADLFSLDKRFSTKSQ